MTAINDIINAHCNACGGTRKHQVIFCDVRETEEQATETLMIWYQDEFALLECRGCSSVKLRHQSMFSEDCDDDGRVIVHEKLYPPNTFRPEPSWLRQIDHEFHITKLMREVYQALQAGSLSLSAMGIRAVIEAVMIDKSGDNGTFANNLNAFQIGGYISDVQREILSSALEIGHASIHRGFIPNQYQLSICVDIMEGLVHTLYLLGDQAIFSVRNLPSRKG